MLDLTIRSLGKLLLFQTKLLFVQQALMPELL